MESRYFEEEVLRWAAQRRGNCLPLVVSMELTARCNFRCVHCYVSGANRSPRKDQLSFEQWRDIIDQWVGLGGIFLTFTGGECLCRPDFVDLYRHAWDLGCQMRVFTNGSRVTDALVREWLRRPPAGIEMSIYGASAETYGAVTGDPGNWELAYRGLERLVRTALPVILKTVAMTLNVHELDAMRAFALEQTGAPLVADPLICASLAGNQPLAYRLSVDETAAVMEQNERLRQAHPSGHDRVDPVQYLRNANEGRLAGNPIYRRVSPCSAGKLGCWVSSDGRLCACSVDREPGYDLTTGSFAEGFQNDMQDYKRRLRTTSLACDSCGYAPICSSCSGHVRLEAGTAESIAPFFCQVTKAYARRMGLAEIAEEYSGKLSTIDPPSPAPPRALATRGMEQV